MVIRVLEKQLSQTDKPLTNLLKAIEAGIFTITTKNGGFYLLKYFLSSSNRTGRYQAKAPKVNGHKIVA